jgi:hypothetical protein
MFFDDIEQVAADGLPPAASKPTWLDQVGLFAWTHWHAIEVCLELIS